jgi:hypothetical protein
LGDASGDTLTLHGSTVSTPNGLNFDSNTFVIDASNNRVGVGTASPNQSLQVAGNIQAGNLYFGGATSDAGTIASDSTGSSTAILMYGSTASPASTMRFTTNGAERMRIDSSGNVGIGTSSAGAKLDAYNSSTTSTALRARNDSVSVYLDANNGYSYLNTFTNHPMLFGTNNAERMRITNDGIVCIGTSSPNSSNKLEVIGNITAGSGSASGVLAGHQYPNGNPDASIIVSLNEAGATNDTRRLNICLLPGTSQDDRVVFYRHIFSRADYSASSHTFSSGNVTIVGSLSKGSGSFKIDHPLPEKTETHHLVHSFIEGPQADNIYRGKVDLVDGRAEVNIDTASGMTEGTFVVLNRDVQCFTSNESDWDAVRGSVSGNILTIECQNAESTATISWLVIGERKDKHMYDTDWTDKNGKVIVEPLKSPTLKPIQESK